MGYLEASLIKTRERFSGNVYDNSVTTTDTATAIESSRTLLRDVVIYNNSANDAKIGTNSAQFTLKAGASLGFTKVDLSKLYVKSAVSGSAATLEIIGVKE